MNPDRHAARLGEARKHLAAKRHADAAQLCRNVLRRDPRCAEAYELLGDALHADGKLADALDAYRQAVRIAPSRTEAWWGLSGVLRARGDVAEAVAALQRLTGLRADDQQAWHNLGVSLHQLGRTDDAVDALARSVRMEGEVAGMSVGSIATIIPGSPRADHAVVLAARRLWASGLPVVPASPPPGVPDRPVRLGYVCSFFQDRNWMKPVWGVVNRHDRERFEVHLFSEGPADAITHGYRPHPSDHFHDFSRLTNAELAARIRSAGIDVLVDLNGFSRMNRLPPFTERPAPVQVGWFNLYATSGVPGLDFLLGDADVIRPDEETFFSERVIRLPRCYLTYEVTYPVPELVPPPCVAGKGFTFGCLAPQYKVTPDVLDVWAAILTRAPNSRLLLKGRFLGRPGNAAYLREQFARRGVAPDRVTLDGPAEHFTFLKAYNAIDVALDTFPYNGGTTTMEALWQGVPVLCFDGDRWAARIGASMMRTAGLGEYVADDATGYVNLAVALATDPGTPARLTELRAGMRDRLRASRLGDVPAFTRELEAVYLSLLTAT